MECKQTLLGKIRVKLSIKVSKPRDRGMTESIKTVITMLSAAQEGKKCKS